MAKLIRFHVPETHTRQEHWVPPRLRGRVIAFEPRTMRQLFLKRIQVVSTLSRTASTLGG
jgi:hypothetical protein